MDKPESSGHLKDTGRPDPDPTLLTTQALFREVASLKELIEQKIKSSENLFNEKFQSITTQFELIEKQRVEQKKDTKDAVDAALAAAKEAVKEQTLSSEKAISKSETATKEILNQMSTTFSTANAGNQKTTEDLKERIVSVEQRVIGVEQQKVGAKEDRTGLYAAIGVIATLLGIAAVILSR